MILQINDLPINIIKLKNKINFLNKNNNKQVQEVTWIQKIVLLKTFFKQMKIKMLQFKNLQIFKVIKI